MSLDIVALRAKVWRPLGFDDDNTDELPRSLIDLNLNISMWEIMDKFHFREKEVRGTFVTTASLNRYDMPEPFEALQHLAIVDPESLQHIPLIRMEADTYESVYNENEENEGFPTHYVREGCSVRMWPTPDVEYTIIIRRLITLTDISASNSIPDMPQAWHELIAFGGLWRSAMDIGDVNRGGNFRALQVSMMNSMIPTEMKEKVANSRLAGLNVIGRDYDQVYDNNFER